MNGTVHFPLPPYVPAGDGTQGPQGFQGVIGETGPQGTQGTQGVQGPRGVQDLNTFTPTFSFATPGNLSVSYNTAVGQYQVIGNTLVFSLLLDFTPTYTTASGGVRIQGFPVEFGDLTTIVNMVIQNAVTWPTGTTQVYARTAGSAGLQIISFGASAGFVEWDTTQFPSGSSRAMRISGTAFIA